MARVEDNWINKILGGNQTIWEKNQWAKKLNIDQNLDDADYGKGYGKEDISNLPDMNIDQLKLFYKDQRKASLDVIINLKDEDLENIHGTLEEITGEIYRIAEELGADL